MAKRRPEMIMFVIGLLLFGGGLASVVVRQLRPDGPAETPRVTDPSVDPAAGKAGRIGPNQGEAVAPYIERKKQLLKRRSSQDASGKSIAVVVFGSYLKVAEVDDFIKTNRLNPLQVQLRVQALGFKPVLVEPKGKPVAEAVSKEIGPERLGEVKAELEQLESVLKDVDDPEFEAVYKQDADAHRQAVKILSGDPATIYGIVVEASNGALAKLGSAKNVRLVDLPDEVGATAETHTFAAILPEDSETAGFAA